jgi:hypothetical protein
MKILEQVIVVNRVKCGKCGELITSTHQHDFRWCKCNSIAVDGGNAYLKRCGDIYGCIEMSEYGYQEREVLGYSEDMYRDMAERGEIKILED